METRKMKEAIRAKEIALEKMQSKDFSGARKFAIKAQQLCHDLDKIDQLIMVCDVHCSVAQSSCQDEKDWYKILNIEPTANEAVVRRQCNRMALNLHPDKNSFPGAADAFHLVVEAKAVLTDNERRRLYDSRCNANVMGNWNYGFQSYKPSTSSWPNGGGVSKQNSSNEPKKRGRKKKVAATDDAARKVHPKVAGAKGKRAAKSAPKSKESGKQCIKTRGAKESRKHGASTEGCGDHGKTIHFQGKSAFGITPNSKIFEYTDGEFNDFEKERGKKCFSDGQIWAVYDTLDAMPRFYALINKVVQEDFKLNITWLEPVPNNDDEKKWLHQGLPACLGKFKLGHSETIEVHAIFSHLVMNWQKSANLHEFYEIYPRKGETWALFKNWDIDWYKNPQRYEEYEFELVEIVSDYYGEFGVTVSFLSKMEGFSSSFSRTTGKGLNLEVIHVKSRFRFSHKVHSFSVSVNDGSNGVKNFFELDSASIPRNFSST